MDFIAVAIGGFLGALTRAELGKMLDGIFIPFPLGTFTINVSGCFFMAAIMTYLTKKYEVNEKLRLAIGSGFFGAYTTYSTFALDAINLLNQSFWFIIYILSTTCGCMIATWLGVRLSEAFTSDNHIGSNVEED